VTATFPFRSNKLIILSQLICGLELIALEDPVSALQASFGSTAGSGPAGWCIAVPDISDPRLLIDHRDAPAAVAVAREMIEPRHRTIVGANRQRIRAARTAGVGPVQ
jgi:hypothetical protein